MLSDRCLSVLSVCPVLSVCNVRALWPNGWTDHDETWHAGRPRPWPHCVRWGPSSPKEAQPPIFGPYLLRSNGCMDQDVTWYGARPRPRRLCVRSGPSTLPQDGWSPPRQFSAHIYCGQMAGCIKMPLVTEVDLDAGHIVLDGVPTPAKGAQHPPPSFRPMSIVATVAHLSYCWALVKVYEDRPDDSYTAFQWRPLNYTHSLWFS